MQGDRKEKRMLSLKRLVSSVLALGLSTAVFASPAIADGPTRTSIAFSFTATINDVCPFAFDVNGTVSGTQTDFFDKYGLVKRTWHLVEQDVFTANGKTLEGMPFTFNSVFLYDNQGNQTSLIATGIVEKVRLPDGSLFISAGWVDFNNHLGYVLSADKGNPGNIAGFCAALAP
jgi:hypothetical protein